MRVLVYNGLISRKAKWGFLFWDSSCLGDPVCSRAQAFSPGTITRLAFELRGHLYPYSCFLMCRCADGRLLCVPLWLCCTYRVCAGSCSFQTLSISVLFIVKENFFFFLDSRLTCELLIVCFTPFSLMGCLSGY